MRTPWKRSAMAIVRRLGAALATLAILSVLVFLGTQVLPGDVARNILGPSATNDQVAALNAQLGTDRPLMEQYSSWVGGLLTGDLGMSAASGQPVADVVWPALQNSTKLALLTLVLMLPLGVAGGIVAALNRGRFVDRALVIIGAAVTSIPEFAWAVFAITTLGLGANVLPVSATAPPGSSILVQLEHLLMPALCLVVVLFGYLMRVTRASANEVLDSDYLRSARLKGISGAKVVARHVLPNSVGPTIAVTATQMGYLFGGLVTIEFIFDYRGLGYVLFQAAGSKDYPLLASGVLIMGLVFLVFTVLADLTISLIDPRVRGGAT